MQRSSQGCSVFSCCSQRRLSLNHCQAMLSTAVTLSYMSVTLPLILPSKVYSWPFSFPGDPSSCPCFKPQREEISKAEMWDRCVTTPHLLMCCSGLPFPDISCRQECLMDLGMYIPLHILIFSSLFFFFKWAT